MSGLLIIDLHSVCHPHFPETREEEHRLEADSLDSVIYDYFIFFIGSILRQLASVKSMGAVKNVID